MNTTKDDALLFASETAIFRIVSVARIVAWVILAVYLTLFVDSIRPMIQGQMPWPTQAAQWINLIANLFFAPAMGLFYFLVLQGIAQLLNLGLDVFYELHPDEEKAAIEEVS